MEDAVKILSTKFNLSVEVFNKISRESEDISSWLTVLGAYVLDNDKKQEEQKSNEVLLRKQRLNAEHKLGQLEKQLISCNTKLYKYEKNLFTVKLDLEKNEEALASSEKKCEEAMSEKNKAVEEHDNLKHRYSHLEQEKIEFAEVLEKKNSEVDRLNEEWNEMSHKLAEANKTRCELQYNLDEIKNSDIRKEFREKRLEQEKSMLLRQMDQITADLKAKSELVIELQKDKTSKLLDVKSKYDISQQENTQLTKSVETFKKTCSQQEAKIGTLIAKLKRAFEEHLEETNNIQQELSAQSKLVQLYKDDRDHAKAKLEEVTTAISELQSILKQANEDKSALEAKLKVEVETSSSKIKELESKIKKQRMELENANDLLQLSRKKGSTLVSEEQLSSLSPMAAATSAILKKGMTLTQIYTEYVKVSDELLSEKDENARLKHYMEQILQEVEEKAPLLMQQKEDYEHAKQTIENMSIKLEENIKECYQLQNQQGEYERKLNFHKREEKRLHTLSVDLSQQVRVLLKEVEEARGGVVSSSETLPELLSGADDLNVSSSGQVISEHLVTFKTIEELQGQNQRLLITVRELSEEQEKLEQEGGPEIIQELKKKIENAKVDLDSLKESQKTQEEMMQQLARQRDMYKVLCQQGRVMVGDISSTSALGSHSILEVETELTRTKAELDSIIGEHMKFKEESTNKERSLNETISKQEEELSSLRLKHDRLKNQLEFAEEKHSILTTTSEGYKNQAKALEEKCTHVTNALNKTRIEAEKYKQEYSEAKEKLVVAEVSVKSLETEKHLVKEAEKRLMQENQSLLDQQRSQNVLLTNLQTIQNNLERQEFETRKTLGKQVDSLQREFRALRRQNETEGHQLKASASSLEKEVKELKIKLGVEMEKSKQISQEFQTSKENTEQLEAKCKELEALNKASEGRLTVVLEREASGREKEDYQHEMERHKTKVRELELAVSNAVTEKKAIEDQLEVMKKHLEQYKEISDSNEQAINDLTKAKETQAEELEKKLTEANDTIKKLKAQVTGVVAEKIHMKKSADAAEKSFQYTISELRGQMAPLERRFQEVTRALVNAKELETSAIKESHSQAQIAKEATDKYERELILHAKDVEQLTFLKDELQVSKSHYDGMEEHLSELKLTLENNEQLMNQMRDHHRKELRKGELARKDLIDQNSILHGQVEKLSAQLASAKSQNREANTQESSTDKSIEEVYELLRFVRREKEIAETKAEASSTESMRYRQRAEHLQRDLDEVKAALELELQRTQGRMLTEEEHKEIMEKVKKSKEYEELNKALEKQKQNEVSKTKSILEKNKKLEAEIKLLQEIKKTLDGEKSSWLAEKTALKAEIERWTNRTNQLMAQNAKTEKENEEVKNLQTLKSQNEKAMSALQDEIKRIKQQLDSLKRESLKLRIEKTESQNKLTSLQAELVAAQSNANKGAATANNEELTSAQRELEEIKKLLQTKTTEMTDKNKIVQQLKKLAKKYKTQSDRLQKLLKDNQIDFSSVLATPTAATESDPAPSTQAADPEEKKKMESELVQKTKTIEDISKQLADLQAQYESDKKSHSELGNKFKDTQKYYADSEKKLFEQTKELETLKTEFNEEKEKQERNKKLLKTAKDKINSLNKTKDSNIREMEALKTQLDDIQKQLQQANNSAVEQTNLFNTMKAQFETKLNNLEEYVDELQDEKKILTDQVEELQRQIEKVQVEKRKAEKFIKAASQQKVRIQALAGATKPVVPVESTATADTAGNAPLTATVRPTATPSVQVTSKYHPQSTPTASIRPLAHAAPTAMISPTVPITQPGTTSTPVASVIALPISAPVTPQVAEVQGRAVSGRHISNERAGTSFKAPVARVTVQVQEREDSADIVPYVEDDHSIDQQPGPSTTDDTSRVPGSKRSRVELEDYEDQEDEDVGLLEDTEGEEPESKRQRVHVDDIQDQQLETDSQEGQMEEDDLLAEEVTEEGDDDVIEAPTHDIPEAIPQQGSGVVSREAQLQMERSFQPSPQELLRQRSLPRGRQQLPSFSLPGQGGSGFYEDTDDSTVPSTPTLFMPRRTDGFAEAVNSPVVRFPAFSFSSNEQVSTSSHTPALEQSGIHLDETRVDLMGPDDPASVPQTPLGIVPSVSTTDLLTSSQVVGIQHDSPSQKRDNRHVRFGRQLIVDDNGDNGQEQNVPQQIDLTEDEDDDNEPDLLPVSRDLDEVITGGEECEDALEIFAPEADTNLIEDPEEEEVEEDGGESESEESEESSETDEEEEQEDGEDEIDEGENQDNNRDDGQDDIVEIDDGEPSADEEEEKKNEQAQDSGETDVLSIAIHENVPEEKESKQDEDSMIITIDPTDELAPDAINQSSVDTGALSDPPSSSAEMTDEQNKEQTKQDESDRPRPVRLQRSTRGIRPRIRRTELPGRVTKTDSSDKTS